MKKLFSLFAAVLFAGSMMAGTYTKTAYADLQNGDVVIITELVGTNVYAASNDKGTSAAPTAVEVAVANDAITTDATNILWTVVKSSDGISFKTGDNYLYCTNSNNGMRVGSNSNNVFSIDATSGYLYNNGTSRFIGVYSSQDWRCYTSVNSNIKDQTLAFYAVAGSTPAEPVVEYYLVGSMNNWTPATGYKLAANAASAGEYMLKTTFAANDQFKVRKVIDGEADAWYPDGTDNNYVINDAGRYNVYFRPDGQGGEGWHQGCIYAARILPKTCAEVYSMAKDDEVLLNNVTVTFANGKNVWVKDATGSMLVYLPANGSFVAGDVLSGVEGVVDIYNGIYEVKLNAAQVEAITATSGEAPAPEELTAVATTDMNKYIVLKNLAVEGEFVEGTASNITLTLSDESTIVLRSNFKNAYAFDAAKTYNITAVVTIYQSNPQLYFISAEEYVAPVEPAEPQLNIMAYGLRASEVADGKVTISYSLNAKATAVEIQLLDAEGVVAETFDAPATGLAKGEHSVEIDLAEVEAGSYHWAVKATARENEALACLTTNANDYGFYSPQGLAVDNSPESDYFGRIYVAESRTATNAAGRSLHEGIYMYNPDLSVVSIGDAISFHGNVAWNESSATDNNGWAWAMYGPGRLAVADDGCVFICDNGRQSAAINTSGVWMMDPANPAADFKEVLSVAQRDVIYHRVNSCAVSGTGDQKVLYIIDWSDSIMSFPVGNCATPYASMGSTVISGLATYNIVNALNTLVRGKDGDLWVFQYRGQLDAYPIITHFNANFERDFYIDKDHNASLAPASNSCRRGGGAVSPDGSKLAFNGNKTIYLYDVAYDANGVPSLSNQQTIAGATNVDAFAFDAANNLYFASASSELFYAYATPKANNSHVTPANSASLIVIHGTGTAVENMYVLKAEKVIRNGQVLIIKDGKTYNMMGQIVE